MRVYSAELGAKINPAVMHEPQIFSRLSEEEKGLECFRAISPERAPTTESAK
jgi:hypothetical protein